MRSWSTFPTRGHCLQDFLFRFLGRRGHAAPPTAPSHAPPLRRGSIRVAPPPPVAALRGHLSFPCVSPPEVAVFKARFAFDPPVPHSNPHTSTRNRICLMVWNIPV